jgi:outer membrane receptor protein involved in Fe transport
MIDLAAVLLSLAVRVSMAERPRIVESVTVTGIDASIAVPAAVTVLDADDLEASPSVTVDDTLRSVPGFSLFRRSSSRVANPTTQGVTLRGLAASGSSRALVLADDVPLNDPVGGWVYWNRVPAIAIRDVSVARGASGDLHGADAMAGVIALHSLDASGARVLAEVGGDETARLSAFGGRRSTPVSLFGAAEGFTTDGFVIVAPESRGTVDTEAASRYASVHGAAAVPAGDTRTTIRASHFGEARRNGTPVQRNRTRVTQLSANVTGLRGLAVRGYTLTQDYMQTFSAVNDDRTAERQTSEQHVEATAFGAAADWGWSTGRHALSLSAATRISDADLEDVSITAAGVRLPPRITTPRQINTAVAAQGALHRQNASLGGGLRTEFWRSSFEGSNDHVFLSPRVWAAFAVNNGLTLRAAYQSAHRGPTINELYRPFRVGDVITEANASLAPEDAHDLEAGAFWQGRAVSFRAASFWTRVDNAIVNVTLSAGGPTIIRQRQNAARIVAKGVELETEVRATPWLWLGGSTSFTGSTFVEGPLEDLRVPQVPRWHHAAGARASAGRFRASAQWRYIGHQFDDDRNVFPLDRSSMTDVRAGWSLRRGIELFGAIENAFDEEQDVGRTPLRTIGLPRTSRIGVRMMF